MIGAAKKIIFSLLICFVVQGAFSDPLEQLITPSYIAQLRSNAGRLMKTYLRDPMPKFMPMSSELREMVNEAIYEVNPTVMLEIMYLNKKPDRFQTDSGTWSDEFKIGIFNEIIMSISSMSGMLYYSASRGTMRTFIENAYVIDGPNTKKRLPDPVFTTPPEVFSLYARQKDTTFGDNIYLYKYRTAESAYFFTQENATTLSVAFIPVIGKGNLKTVMAVFDCGEYILLYAVSMGKAVIVPGMWERISASFSNRVDAILVWFSNKVELL